MLSVARAALGCADHIPRGVLGEVLDERLADRAGDAGLNAQETVSRLARPG
jgi:hypothetical protein